MPSYPIASKGPRITAKRPPSFSQNPRSSSRRGVLYSVVSPLLNHCKEAESEARSSPSLFQARLTCQVSNSPPMAPLFILSPPFPPGRRRTRTSWAPPPPLLPHSLLTVQIGSSLGRTKNGVQEEKEPGQARRRSSCISTRNFLGGEGRQKKETSGFYTYTKTHVQITYQVR